jgi:hypothetical protein
VIKDLGDLEDDDLAPYGSALLAMEEENIVIVLGRLVDLKTFHYDGKSLAFLARPGGGAVVASRSMLTRALAELDAYDRRRGCLPPSTDKPFVTFTNEPDDDSED